MKLVHPVTPYIINQSFGQNANSYYKEGGLLGHTGIDVHCTYGQIIHSSCDGIVFATQNKDNPDLMRYRAVYVLHEEDGIAYEISYGHADHIFVEVGDEVKIGIQLISGGNTGDVASGGIKITREMKLAGSTAGTHLHWQVRLMKRVSKRESRKQYATNDQGFYKKDGDFFEIVNYENGYRGCVDPAQFVEPTVRTPTNPVILYQTLRYGSRGDQVKILQKFLKLKIDGVFGIKTDRAVRDFQQSNGLKVDGVVGPLTRAIINGRIF